MTPDPTSEVINFGHCDWYKEETSDDQSPLAVRSFESGRGVNIKVLNCKNPDGSYLRFATDCPVYLLNENGQTMERV
ncbi:MAG: hypothetical protein ABIG63_04590 [Chloroflexota bacterium]